MSNPTVKFSLTLPSRYKPVAVAAVLVAATLHLLNSGYADWSAGADTAYVLALLLLFFSRETVEDERVESLKLRALTIGFFTGWVVAGVARFASYLQDRQVAPHTMSAYDLMMITLLIAHALFCYWRWQDGRGGSAAPHA